MASSPQKEKKSPKKQDIADIIKIFDNVSPESISTEDLQKLQASLSRQTKARDLEARFSSKELNTLYNAISTWFDKSLQERNNIKNVIEQLEKKYKEKEKEYKKINTRKKDTTEAMQNKSRKDRKLGNSGVYMGTEETDLDKKNQLEIKEIEEAIKDLSIDMKTIQDKKDRADARMTAFKEIKKTQDRVHGLVSRVTITEVLQSKAKNEATKKTLEPKKKKESQKEKTHNKKEEMQNKKEEKTEHHDKKKKSISKSFANLVAKTKQFALKKTKPKKRKTTTHKTKVDKLIEIAKKQKNKYFKSKTKKRNKNKSNKSDGIAM